MTEPTITCINGRFTRAHRAAVPLADRGYRFGDGLFETIRLDDGVPYQWEQHMQRLAQGMAAIGLGAVIDWQGLAQKTIARNGATEGFLRLSISRGVGSRGYQPFPPGMPPTYAIEYLPALPAPDKPYRLWLSSWAKIPNTCLPTSFKLAQGMNSILGQQQAAEHECEEALQLSTSGMLSEAGSANLFWILQGTLYTPSLETGCLGGTTREAVMRLSHLPVRVVQQGLATLEQAEAVFLSNVRLGVHAVAQLQPMGWQFNPSHPDMARIAQAIAADRHRYAARNRAVWEA